MKLSLPFHSVFLVGLLSLPFWIITLGGFAALTAKCNDQSGYSTADCGYNHGLKWFSLWFQLLVVVFVVGATVTRFITKLRLALVAYVTVATLLFIYHSDELVRVTYFQENVLKRGDAYEAYGAAAAGSVLLTIYNFVLIVYVSLVDDSPAAPTHIPTRQVDLGPEQPTQAKTVEAPKATAAPAPVTAETTNV